MKISCIAVDDEPLALELVENFVSKISQLQLKMSFRKPIEAIDFLSKNSVDLVFLDIQMPLLNGLEFAEILKSSNAPKLIFTTAFREFAVESYEHKGVDYLVKPFSFQRFLQAVNKVIELKSMTSGYINIKSESKTFRVSFDDIEYIESFKDYIKVNTSERSLICYQHISNFAEQLPSDLFLRIHRSFIVNLSKIISFNSSYLELGSEELPIGRSYKEKVMSILG
ncbi:LytTR family DNA-binding domain-containing protein [Reichenbachiella sp. MALMAid0571]|uniref:LytR/AlgR family response regulator transcription factor n=1 Tax=Reichenbachiella sp. MALMAid0571 TaxID=3143939 RepID=UPI0032DE82E5